MPVLKHARKKLRQDKKRTIANIKIKDTYKDLVKKAKHAKTSETLRKAFSGLDIAAKKHLMHKNKAARMKSTLSKIADGTAPKQAIAKKKITNKSTVKAAKPSKTKKGSPKKESK